MARIRPFSREFWGGLTFLAAGAIFARETFNWLWQRLLDLLSGSFRGAFDWAAFPWLDAGGLVLFVAGLVILFGLGRKDVVSPPGADIGSGLAITLTSEQLAEWSPEIHGRAILAVSCEIENKTQSDIPGCRISIDWNWENKVIETDLKRGGKLSVPLCHLLMENLSHEILGRRSKGGDEFVRPLEQDILVKVEAFSAALGFSEKSMLLHRPWNHEQALVLCEDQDEIKQYLEDQAADVAE